MIASDDVRHYRTIWISDVHLGTPGCQAHYRLDFLGNYSCDTLYLVGDILDGWQLRKGWYWPQSHNDVVQKLLRCARKGTRVVYVPGHHDALSGQFVGLSFGGIEVLSDDIHVTATDQRLLVTHGDQFDAVMQHARFMARLDSSIYGVLLKLHDWINAIRLRLGMPYWSMSRYRKLQARSAVNFIADFEQAMTEEARRRNCHGVVCGHIHKAEIRRIDGVLYCTVGDWVESLSALVEDQNGDLQPVHWHQRDSVPASACVVDALAA